MSGDWYCPHCRAYVEGRAVTHDEFHQSCGHRVVWHDNRVCISAPLASIDFETGDLTVRLPQSIVRNRWHAGDVHLDLSDVLVFDDAPADDRQRKEGKE